MITFLTDQNSVIQANEYGNSKSSSESINKKDGDVNLYNNDLLTVWKNLTPTVQGSTIRMGNFGRDQFGNVVDSNAVSSYPALLFYRNTVDEDYPVLDIGVQASGSQEVPIISFKKKETEGIVEYANIQLEGNDLVINSNAKTIQKVKKDDLVEFVEETQIITTNDGSGTSNFAEQKKWMKDFIDSKKTVINSNVYKSSIIRTNGSEEEIPTLSKTKKIITSGVLNQNEEIEIYEKTCSQNGMTIIEKNICRGNLYHEIKPIISNFEWSMAIEPGKSPNFIELKDHVDILYIYGEKRKLEERGIRSGYRNYVYYFKRNNKNLKVRYNTKGWKKANPQDKFEETFTFGEFGGQLRLDMDFIFENLDPYFYREERVNIHRVLEKYD